MKHIVATNYTAAELLVEIATRLDGKKKSTNGPVCAYRSKSKDPDVSPACGVGLCLPDEVAEMADSRSMTAYDSVVDDLNLRDMLTPKDLNNTDTDLFYSTIQSVHDGWRGQYINKDIFIDKFLQRIEPPYVFSDASYLYQKICIDLGRS